MLFGVAGVFSLFIFKMKVKSNPNLGEKQGQKVINKNLSYG